MDKNATPSKLQLDDIYFVLFRHKWMISFFLVAALAGGALVWKMSPRLYTSEAKLLVRYIVESSAALPPGGEEQVRQVDRSGNNILNTEVEILGSTDLAAEVAEGVGAEKILGESGVPAAQTLATRVVAEGVSVDLPKYSSVIHVAFSNGDPQVTREVLEELIRVYLKRHQEIHESGNTYDTLAKRTDEMRLRLRETEEALQKLRAETGNVSLEEAQRLVSKEMEFLRESITAVSSELAVRQALSPQQESVLPQVQKAMEVAGGTNGMDLVNSVSPASEAAFLAVQDRLQKLRLREQDYLSRFTEENPMVKSVRRQIADLETQTEILLAENPQLGLKPGSLSTLSTTRNAAVTVEVESSASLAARLSVYTNRLEQARAESIRLSDLEKRISEIQLSRDIQQQNWHYAATSLEQARYGSALELGKNSNINLIQAPTSPVVDTKPLMKRAGMVAGGLAGFGLALAFLIELFLDPRVKRLAQLDRDTRLPVYVSIPKEQRLRRARKVLTQSASRSGGKISKRKALVIQRGNETARPFFEALRDRIIIYFERVNLRRKPKLVGVTACHGRAGVSTIAEGLAASLSETGGGKVLLVDLNHAQEAMQTYLSGQPAASLPEVLQQGESNETEQPANSLQLAAFGSVNGGPHPTRSREFDLLMPKLKASDFDYIVFDMPPLTQTSISYRVAGFMDKVLVVTEAERTHTATLKHSVNLLQESGARVSLVMNKTREYMPRWLRPPQ